MFQKVLDQLMQCAIHHQLSPEHPLTISCQHTHNSMLFNKVPDGMGIVYETDMGVMDTEYAVS